MRTQKSTKIYLTGLLIWIIGIILKFAIDLNNYIYIATLLIYGLLFFISYRVEKRENIIRNRDFRRRMDEIREGYMREIRVGGYGIKPKPSKPYIIDPIEDKYFSI